MSVVGAKLQMTQHYIPFEAYIRSRRNVYLVVNDLEFAMQYSCTIYEVCH